MRNAGLEEAQAGIKISGRNINPVPLPAGYFSAFSSCLYCCVWGNLFVFWQFVVPPYCGGSSLWVGLDGWPIKISWLGKRVSMFWLVELDFFFLE